MPSTAPNPIPNPSDRPRHPRPNHHSRHNRASLGASDTIGPNPNPYPSLNPDRDSGGDSGPNPDSKPEYNLNYLTDIDSSISTASTDPDNGNTVSSKSPYRYQKKLLPATTVTGARFSDQQELALDVLVGRAKGETMQQLADKVGVARMTLWRWLQNAEFKAEYRQRVESELGAHRGRIAQALVRGALTPGVGQAAMQKIYWQKLGEFAAEKLEITGKNGGPIAITATSITLDALLATLSVQAKRDIIEILEREKVLEKAAIGTMGPGIGAGIGAEMLTLEEECDTVTDTVDAEYSISE